jgi:hypothetical protein
MRMSVSGISALLIAAAGTGVYNIAFSFPDPDRLL